MVIIDFLHITPGLPSAETMDRYNRHIMYYDEIMAFTYFFSRMTKMMISGANFTSILRTIH